MLFFNLINKFTILMFLTIQQYSFNFLTKNSTTLKFAIFILVSLLFLFFSCDNSYYCMDNEVSLVDDVSAFVEPEPVYTRPLVQTETANEILLSAIFDILFWVGIASVFIAFGVLTWVSTLFVIGWLSRLTKDYTVDLLAFPEPAQVLVSDLSVNTHSDVLILLLLWLVFLLSFYLGIIFRVETTAPPTPLSLLLAKHKGDLCLTNNCSLENIPRKQDYLLGITSRPSGYRKQRFKTNVVNRCTCLTIGCCLKKKNFPHAASFRKKPVVY